VKAILHIGTGRTGTTAIQSSLIQNKHELKNNGIGILKSVGRGNNIELAKFCKANLNNPFFIKNNILTEADKSKFEQLVRDKFKCEIKCLEEQGIKRILISSEHFITDLRTSKEINKLKELLDECEIHVSKIIIYIREQVSYLFSEYSNKLAMGLESRYPPPIPKKINTCSLNHDYSIEMWNSIFSSSEFVVNIFQKDILKNNCVVSDFYMLLDLHDNFQPSSEITNFSLSGNGLELMRFGIIYLNSHDIIGEERQYFLRVLRNYCHNKLKGPKAKPNYEFAMYIRDKFGKSNERVRAKYFPDKNQLFQDVATTKVISCFDVENEWGVFIERCAKEFPPTLNII